MTKSFNDEITEDLEALLKKLQKSKKTLGSHYNLYLTKKEILDMYRFTLDRNNQRYMIVCTETGIGTAMTIQTVEDNPVKMDITDLDSW